MTTKQTISEGDETTSFAGTVKNLFQKHRKKIAIGGTTLVAAAGVALIGLAKGQGKANRPDDDEGWSQEGADWFNSLSVEEFVDLMWLGDYGVQDEEDQKLLETLRGSYEEATSQSRCRAGV
ncbi:hypothetical protein [Streptomyces hoynatensis]|uniref:Uncharacterized protein n=1 Tax=Streptomyces hoynatensis TaxID=1141874 RepID=A0A3A9Z4T0_9ACTN|nr:hypothetical protein [Streptomyces hoynatensis]RKN43210.1 hypothetical protein D7294_12135 [Streptomyces hoynatensis]